MNVPTLSANAYVRFLEAAVREKLGAGAARVAGVLARGGQKPLVALQSAAKLSKTQITTILRAMLQNNFLEVDVSNKTRALYTLCHQEVRTACTFVGDINLTIIIQVCMSIRAPKYALYIGEKLGVEAEVVVEQLSEHGRLTMKQMCQLYRQRRSASDAEGRDIARLEKAENRLRIVIKSMIDQHYLTKYENIVGFRSCN